jgi:hypothetical protein
MDVRELKAKELAERSQIVFRHGAYWVPSQTNGTRYRVDINAVVPSCSCPDHELRGGDCKHILAVRLFVQRQQQGEPLPPPSTEPTPKVKRPTYPQDWPNYNAAQTGEKAHFQRLLADLCRGIPQPPPKGGLKGGRPAVSLADAVFSVVFKVYSTLSTRRFMTDLEVAHKKGHVRQLVSYASVFKCLENPEVTPILHSLIRQSSLPLAGIETKFAIDSSGFCTSRFTRWFDVKYGVTREEADWVKVHIAVGVATTVVTAVEILDKHAGG